MEKLGGRKFTFAVFLVALGFILVLTGKLSPSDWVSSAQIIGGIYVLGNVGSKFTSKNTP